MRKKDDRQKGNTNGTVNLMRDLFSGSRFCKFVGVPFFDSQRRSGHAVTPKSHKIAVDWFVSWLKP